MLVHFSLECASFGDFAETSSVVGAKEAVYVEGLGLDDLGGGYVDGGGR